MPAAIGAAVLTAVGATTLAASATATAIVGNIIIAGGLIGLQLLTAGSPGSTEAALPRPADGRQPLRQARPPRIAGFGRCRLAGAYMLYEERGGTSYDVVALCQGPITAFINFYLHDDRVEINGTTGFVEGVGTSAQGGQKNDGRFVETVRILTRLGNTPEDEYTAIVDNLPDLWTNDHRGDGVASAALICDGVDEADFRDVYPHGLPVLSVVADLLPCFDPRDGDQVVDDPTTWVLTSNPVLQLLRFLTDTDIGMGFDYEDVIEPVLSEWMVEANLAEQEGYASNGFYRLDTDPSEVLGMLLATCDGWLTEDGEGHIIPVVGSYRAPTIEILEKHILGFSFRFGVDDEQAVNELQFTFTSPDHDYNELPGDPWRDEDDISERGRVRSQTLPLIWVQDHTQARKLAKRAMERLMASARGRLKVTLFGLTALGHRWIGLRYPFLSTFENAVLEVENIEVDLEAGCVTIDWVLVDGAALTDFDEEEEAGTPPLPPPPPVSLVDGILDNDGENITDNDGEFILA